MYVTRVLPLLEAVAGLHWCLALLVRYDHIPTTARLLYDYINTRCYIGTLGGYTALLHGYTAVAAT